MSAEVYVSATLGSDSNSGTSPGAALATLPAALAAVARLRAGALLLDGTFRPTAPLTLSAAHAGLRLDAWPTPLRSTPTLPVLSGAALLPASAWAPSATGEPGVWQAALSPALSAALDFGAAIYVGGAARAVVRSPTRHWNASLGPRGSAANLHGFVYSAGDVPAAWSLAPASVARWRVAAFHSWNKAYHRVRAVTPANRTLSFTGPAQFGYGTTGTAPSSVTTSRTCPRWRCHRSAAAGAPRARRSTTRRSRASA